MDKALHHLLRSKRYLHTHTKVLLAIALGIVALLYILVFGVPKTVAFNYAGQTCAKQLSILPGLHKASSDSSYHTNFEGGVNVGSVKLLSTKTCFTPQVEPKAGVANVATSPFGSIAAKKQFRIVIAEPPVASVAGETKNIPVSKPLAVMLSSPDTVYSYSLKTEAANAACASSDNTLQCDVPKLSLAQGKEYTLKLVRKFKASAESAVTDISVKTLKAVKVQKSPLKNNQTVYSKPKSFSFTTDKPLNSVSTTLTRLDGNKKAVSTTSAVKDNSFVVTLSKQLDRNATYRLVVSKVVAQDGSTLIEPFTRTFKMSGGPAVQSVSIGASRVGSSETIAIRFDQALGSQKDVAKFIAVNGGGYTLNVSGNVAYVTLSSLPRCKPFTLQVKKGIASKYEIASSQDWSHRSRTTCHTTMSYGTSVHGRPLMAYIFGDSGPVTMYVGAIHGNEASSSGLMQAWISELERYPDRFRGKRIVVIPTINPDGLANGTRTNSRGVNLSRNFPTDNWTSDIDDTDGRHKGGGGKKPLSEPEAAALASITKQYRPRLLLSFHAVGSLVVGDPGGYSASYASKYASLVGYHNATGGAGTFDYDITGAYEDWSYRNEGIPSMVIELGSYSAYYIDHHRSALWAMLN